MGREAKAKIVIAMCMGFALAAVGMDTVSGTLRMTFGSTELLRGFDFLVAVIGLFGISEILITMEEGVAFTRQEGRHRPQGGAQDLGRAAALLDDADPLVGDWLLAGRDAGRRHGGVRSWAMAWPRSFAKRPG